MTNLVSIPIPFSPSLSNESLVLSAQLMPCLPERPTWDDKIKDWPRAISDTQFLCEIYDSKKQKIFSVIEGEGLTRQSENSDEQSKAWKEVFAPERVVLDPVNAVQGPKTEESTFNSSALDGSHRLHYTQQLLLAATPGEKREGLLKALDAWNQANQPAIRLFSEAQSDFRSFMRSISNKTPEDQYFQFENTDKVSFSSAIHGVTSYHQFSKNLALTVDFTIILPDRAPQAGFIRLIPIGSDGPFLSSNYSAFKVAYELVRDKASLKAWMPRPQKGKNHWGLVHFNSKFSITQQDLDGTEFKRRNDVQDPDGLATPQKETRDRLDKEIYDDVDLPSSMRTNGFMFLERKAAANKKSQEERAKQGWKECESIEPQTPLFMEDLITGYRFDVMTNGSRFSLHEHHASHIGKFARVLLHRDDLAENFVERSSTFTKNQNTNVITENIHEALAVWDGWSFAHPRPSNVKTSPPSLNQAPFHEHIGILEGRLPRLRVGRSYQFACRVVFVNGLGIKKDEQLPFDINKYLSAPEVFCRVDSIGSPMVAQKARSRAGNPAVQSVNEVMVGRETGYQRYQERWFFPPKAEWVLCENLGALDDYSENPQKQHELIKDRVKPGSANSKDSALDPGKKLDYLPDPDCLSADIEITLKSRSYQFVGRESDKQLAGNVLMDLKNQTWKGNVSYYSRKHRWPNPKPFSIEVRALRKGDSYVKPPKRLKPGASICVYQAPGDRIEIKVSSNGRKHNFLLENWIRSADQIFTSSKAKDLSPAQKSLVNKIGGHIGTLKETFKYAIENISKNPLFTPPVRLQTVHAVSQPVSKIQTGSPTISRQKGSNNAYLLDLLTVDGATTNEISLVARWVDQIDDPGQLAPSTSTIQKAISTSVSVDPIANKKQIIEGDLQFQLNGAGAKKLKCQLIARGRYPSHSRNVEGVNIGDEFELIAPNVSTPSQPEVRHLVPLYLWDRYKHTEGALKSKRVGYSFRVYLGRPWGYTGPNEQLGVVCWPDDMAQISAEDRDLLYPYVAQWGMEPLLETEPLSAGPFASHFMDLSDHPSTNLERSGITLREFSQDDKLERYSTRRVSLATFKPTFDENKRLWFVDIGIKEQPSYMPWLKMSFVRYQPASIEGCFISQVSQSFLTQLQPNRNTTVTVSPVDKQLVQVSTTGSSGRGHESGIETPELSLILQKWKYGDIWEPYSDPVMMEHSGGLGFGSGWSASIRLPRGRAKGFRIEIRETYKAQQDRKNALGVPRPGIYGKRTVYIEHIPLKTLLRSNPTTQEWRGSK